MLAGLGEFEHSFQSQVETTRARSNGHVRALRKYCDICETFDAHDTEECPQQSSAGPEPGHTYNAVARGEERPYCSLCEKFGHIVQNCPENETF